MHRGSCLCGAVSFEVDGELPPPDACHCTQCRKQSGHFFASTDVKRQALTVMGFPRMRNEVAVCRAMCSRGTGHVLTRGSSRYGKCAVLSQRSVSCRAA
jgi:hypothetical protein